MNAVKKVLVVYFSHSGNTARVARDLAARLDADVEALQDLQEGSGWLNTLRAAGRAWRKRPAGIRPPQHDPADYALTVIGTPVWAWQMTPAVRGYLQQVGRGLREVAFFVTSGNTDISRVGPTLAVLAGREAIASTGFNERELHSGELYLQKLEAFAREISSALGAGEHGSPTAA
jgi:hypothetical protein